MKDSPIVVGVSDRFRVITDKKLSLIFFVKQLSANVIDIILISKFKSREGSIPHTSLLSTSRSYRGMKKRSEKISTYKYDYL